jgi:hypothetical protein
MIRLRVSFTLGRHSCLMQADSIPACGHTSAK